ncbi:MAG TPA: UvrB/UvrC motif-containing protein [Gemmataceae bacterium]|nr:UvrB/UvrC motif-containing protein [Gemmataceae bacterium]
MLTCEKCKTRTAAYHITDVISEEQYEELHLCEECYQKYYEPSMHGASSKGESSAAAEADETGALGQRQCPNCGIRFVEFRNSGRLGCPHDYQEFREELLPLLENIHGEVRHCGKVPRRQPQNRQTQTELIQLRKQLLQAITREAYEEAAQLRDRIRRLEEC